MRHSVLLRLFILAGLAMISACTNQHFGEATDDGIPAIATSGENTVLNTVQLGLLFDGVTAYGRRLSDNTAFKRFYSANGHVIDLHPLEGRREGRWRVVDGELCINWDSWQECALIKRENNRITQYRQSAAGELQKSIHYERFLRGNPEQLE